MTKAASRVSSADSSSMNTLSPARAWLGVVALGVGIFSLVTTELLPIGLLADISSDLDISDGTAGLMVTVPGIVAAIAAPTAAVVAGRLDRRRALCGLIGLMAVANLAAAIAPSFTVLLAARSLAGISIGGFWAMVSGLPVRLVPTKYVIRATSVIFSGISIASVVGVPATTVIGEFGGWRSAFAAMGFLGLAIMGALAFLLPPLPVATAFRAGDMPALFRKKGMQAVIVAAFLLVTGHFVAYTFIGPFLREMSNIGTDSLSSYLLIYGAAGIAGNFLAGWGVSRNLGRTLALITMTLPVALALLPVLGTWRVAAAGLLVAWGLAYGAVAVSLQAWVFKTAASTTEAATALVDCAFNLSISLGGLIGGLAIDGISASAVMWIGGALIALNLVTLRSVGKAAA